MDVKVFATRLDESEIQKRENDAPCVAVSAL